MRIIEDVVLISLLLCVLISGVLSLPGVIVGYLPWAGGKAIRGRLARRLGTIMLALAIFSVLQILFLRLSDIDKVLWNALLVAAHIGCWIYLSRHAARAEPMQDEQQEPSHEGEPGKDAEGGQ